MKKYLFKTISVSAVTFSCLALLNLSACGKKGPLYLEEPKNTQTQQTTKDKKTEQQEN